MGGGSGLSPRQPAAAAMEVSCVLLAAALLALLPPGRAAGPLPTLAPPLSMEVAGQHRRLVVCVEDGGTICTVSLLPDDLPAEGDLACHVGPTTTSPAQSSSPIPITGNDEVAELCPSNMAVPLLHASTALLVAVRVVLLKVALSSALFTSVLLAQS